MFVLATVLTVSASLIGVTGFRRSNAGGSTTITDTSALPSVFSGFPVYNVPSIIPHAATCDPSLPDVSAALQKWITSLPNYSIGRLAASQCYHTEYSLTIGAKTLLLFDGNGSTFASYTDGCDGTRIGPQQFVNCRYPSPVDALGRTQSDWPRQRTHLSLIGNRNLIIVNLHIEGGKATPGYNVDYAFQHGIAITGTSDGTLIANVTVDHVWGDFVNFSSHYSPTTKTTTHPEGVTIENSRFGLDRTYMGSGRQGFTIDDGADIHVQNNVIQYSSRSAVDIEPVSDRSVLQHIYFEHNTFGPHANNLFANHYYGTANPTIDGVYFRYNNLVGTPLLVDSVVPDVSSIDQNSPSTYHRHDYQFVGNRSDTVYASGTCPGPNQAVRLWGVDGVVIQDNVAPVGAIRCMTLVDAAKLHNSRIVNNSVYNAIRTSSRYYQSADFCEKNDLVGAPLTADMSTLAPRCSS